MTQTAIIYTRIGSVRQSRRAGQLRVQEDRCREYALYKGYDLKKIFSDEGFSGNSIDRPALKQMLTWLEKHKSEKPIILIDDVSRLARNLTTHLELKAAIASTGARLETFSMIQSNASDHQFFENILTALAQYRDEQESEKGGR